MMPSVPSGAEHQPSKIEAYRLARRRAGSLQLAGGGDDVHVQHDVFDIAVAVFLHAAGVGGDPAAQRRNSTLSGSWPMVRPYVFKVSMI